MGCAPLRQTGKRMGWQTGVCIALARGNALGRGVLNQSSTGHKRVTNVQHESEAPPTVRQRQRQTTCGRATKATLQSRTRVLAPQHPGGESSAQNQNLHQVASAAAVVVSSLRYQLTSKNRNTQIATPPPSTTTHHPKKKCPTRQTAPPPTKNDHLTM